MFKQVRLVLVGCPPMPVLTSNLFVLTLENLPGSVGFLFNSGNIWGLLPKSVTSWILAHKICISFLFGREKEKVGILEAS